MKTMEEKAAEVVARWQELHPLGLSVSDIRAAVDSLKSSVPRNIDEELTKAKDELRKSGKTFESIDWTKWHENMQKAIDKTSMILEATQHGNNNSILAKCKPPITWVQDVAVVEMEEWPGWWAVVLPDNDWMSFCGKDGKENATKAANGWIERRDKK